ncbi:MAG: selenide, water dikinase SelD [Promethearchaeota archaeon]|nr:MAG: selenide, water dikinase SelD [Candidatus Lokiarchaeota archaeon]
MDIFTPIIDDPKIQGEIAACNVTNDIFAMNVPEINSGMLAFLGIPLNAPSDIVEDMLLGVKNFMENKINSKIVGGHTIYCDWPLIGGEASGIINQNSIIRKSGVRKGDKLVLTKPIGIQSVMAAYRVLKEMPEILESYSKSELYNSIDIAIKVMTTPNQEVVRTIHSFEDFSFVHAISDVTGFGLAGHTKEMLQHSSLSAMITKIPSIKLSEQLSAELGYAFEDCQSSETAGGMLMAIDQEKVEEFTNTLSANKIPNWIVGYIDDKDPSQVRVSQELENLEISKF